jgi:hypothetical protein
VINSFSRTIVLLGFNYIYLTHVIIYQRSARDPIEMYKIVLIHLDREIFPQNKKIFACYLQVLSFTSFLIIFINGSSSPFRAQVSYSVPKSRFTDGRIPWTSDQTIARSLTKQRTTETQSTRIYTPNVHTSNGIRTHDPSVRVSKDSSYLRPRGYCDRLILITYNCPIILLDIILFTSFVTIK